MPFFICIFYKFYSFRNFMQTTERKNFCNLRNLKNLKNYGSLTLRTIEKRWQFHGKIMALTFKVSKKVSKVSRKRLEKCEKCLVPRLTTLPQTITISFLYWFLKTEINSQVIHCLYLPYICSNQLR